MPIFYPGIICVHDIKYKTGIGIKVKENLYKKLSKLWHLLQYQLAWRYSPLILTVSEYSKRQIINIYGVSSEKILVVGNGWDHFKRIEADDSIFEREKEWFETPYFFSVSSITPNKNLKWIIEVAKLHSQYKFIVGGNLCKWENGHSAETIPSNMVITGYLKDGEIKSLMKRAKAFLFPSFAEGFGIPPLEALSVGCPAIISNTTCLPEIFGNTVHYIDPYCADVNLDTILSEPVESPDRVLSKYTYKEAAKLLYEKLIELNYL